MNPFVHTRYDMPATGPIDRYAFARDATYDAIATVIREIVDAAGPPAGTPVVVKPNLNNDLCALSGNSVDLRILSALFEALKAKGISDILLAEGMNVGVDRRRINGFSRLRVDRLAAAHGVRLFNVNEAEQMSVALSNSEGRIAREIFDARFLISVCKIKTHAEAVFSGAMKNWVGISVGQHKRRMHDNLAENIVAVNELVKPHLVIVDGLVAMAGNGPGDGYPVRLDTVLAGCDAAAIDLFACRIAGIPSEEVPYLSIACSHDPALARTRDAIAATVEPHITLERAPLRSPLARLSDAAELRWLKKRVQPFLSQGPLLVLAYRLKIVQDVYSLEDDALSCIAVTSAAAARYAALLDCVCPRRFEEVRRSAQFSEAEIVVSSSPRCIGCLYCFWALPAEAVRISGNPGFLGRHIVKYKSRIEGLFRAAVSGSRK